MLSKDPNYRRLKKLGGRGSFGSSYYWLGKDHLLLVEVSGYSEKYRRFFFRDIQTVLMEQTRRRMWFAITLGLPTVLCLAVIPIAFLDMANDGEPWDLSVVIGLTWLGLAAVFGIPLLISILRGPGASVSLRTAVQTFKLPGITRWKRGELLVNELTPLVLAAQTTAPVAAPPVTAAPVGEVSPAFAPSPAPET